MRVKVVLACTECKQRNYNTMKNKKNDPDRLEMKKYCRFCKKHTLHRRANLVDFDENRVCAAEFDTFFEVLDVGNEEVVANELAAVTDEVGENLPAFPVAFGHAVFNRVDGEFLDEFLEEFGLECGKALKKEYRELISRS